MPGLITALREWLRLYKTCMGKPPNEFALGEKCMPKDYAMGVVEETHGFWKNLIKVKGGMAVVGK